MAAKKSAQILYFCYLKSHNSPLVLIIYACSWFGGLQVYKATNFA